MENEKDIDAEMTKRQEKMTDGKRYIIYYTFEPESKEETKNV